MTTLTTIAELESLYGQPKQTALVKETDRISKPYRALIEASPFVALATSGPEGLDCSPRGDQFGFVRVHDSKTLMIPDRRGNNRVDSLRNIVRDPRIALLCLIPGSATTLRINGHAVISVEPQLLQSFAVGNALPRSVIIMTVEALYYQCSRAIMRSGLWDGDPAVDPAQLPTPGVILADLSADTLGGESYDREWQSQAKETLW